VIKLTNIIHRWDDLQRLKEGEMILPRFVDFHTSNVCDQHCLGCCYNGKLDSLYMSETDHFDVVDRLLKVGVKAFEFAGGGDPCLLPYLPDLIRYIHSHGAHSSVLTNGTMLSNDLVRAIVDCCTYIRISLEAANEHDYVAYKRTPPGMWGSALNGIARLQDYKDQTKSALEISVKFGVGKTLRGPKHYADAINLGVALNAARITIRALRHEPEELTYDEKLQEQDFLTEELCEWPQDVRDRVSFWIVPWKFEDVPQCWLNPTHVVVDHIGNLWTCCYFYYRESQMFLGNMLKESFAKIWFSDHHRKQIAGIKREDCFRVDCKFFAHHTAVKELSVRGNVEWL